MKRKMTDSLLFAVLVLVFDMFQAGEALVGDVLENRA